MSLTLRFKATSLACLRRTAADGGLQGATGLGTVSGRLEAEPLECTKGDLEHDSLLLGLSVESLAVTVQIFPSVPTVEVT